MNDFTDLGDVPGSYSGAGDKLVKVNTGATGLEFVTLDSLVPDSTELLKGKIEIATQGETDAGSDDTRAITPLKLKTYVQNSISLESAGFIPTTLAASVSLLSKVNNIVYSNSNTNLPVSSVSVIFVKKMNAWLTFFSS